ncbi:uncharacterized [Tachysurus ichikawai]
MKLWVLLFKGNEMYTFFWCAAKPIVVLPDISLSSSEEWIYFVFVKLDLFGRGLKETLACGYIIMMVSAFITCSSWLARLPIVAWISCSEEIDCANTHGVFTPAEHKEAQAFTEREPQERNSLYPFVFCPVRMVHPKPFLFPLNSIDWQWSVTAPDSVALLPATMLEGISTPELTESH